MGKILRRGSLVDVKKAKAKVKGAEDCGTTPASAGSRFVSGRGESEEETIDWKIEDVAEFFEMSEAELAENGLVFEAGTCVLKDGTRTRATWKFRFLLAKENDEDWIGGYLGLQNDKSNIKLAKASHCVSFSSGGIPIFYTSHKLTASKRKDGVDFTTYEWGYEKLMKKSELLEKTKETNSLEVSLLVRVFSNDRFKPVLLEPSSSPKEVIELKGQATSDFLKMLESGIGADVEIRVPKEVGGKIDDSSYTKKVNKGILMARSSVFETMFAPESEMTEAQTGKIVIEDMSPKGLDVFLSYLYTGEVSEDWLNVPEEILNASEKYGLGKLKQHCGQNLISAVTSSNAFSLYDLAKLHQLSFAKNAIAKFISKNTTSVLDAGDVSSDEENGEQDEGEGEEREGDNA